MKCGLTMEAVYLPDSGLPLFSVFESPIIHSVCPSPHSPPKWEDCIFHFLRACENNNLGRIWGTNRVYYGLFGNSQWFLCWQRSRSRREKNEKNYHCKFPWLAGWWCGAGLTNSPPHSPPPEKRKELPFGSLKGKTHEVSMSLKEPKRVKAVESSQSGGTRQKVLVRQRGGLVRLLARQNYWWWWWSMPLPLTNDCLSLRLWRI